MEDSEQEEQQHDIMTCNTYWQILHAYFKLYCGKDIPNNIPSRITRPYVLRFQIPTEYNPYFKEISLRVDRDDIQTLAFVTSDDSSQDGEIMDPEHEDFKEHIIGWLNKHANQNSIFTRYFKTMNDYFREHGLTLQPNVRVEQYIDACLYLITPPPGFSHTTTRIVLTIYSNDLTPDKIYCENTGGFSKNTTSIWSRKLKDPEFEQTIKEWLHHNRGLDTTFIKKIFSQYLETMNAFFKANGLNEIPSSSVIPQDHRENGQDYTFTPPDNYNPDVTSIKLTFDINNEYNGQEFISRAYNECIECANKGIRDGNSEKTINDPTSGYQSCISLLLTRRTKSIPTISEDNKTKIMNWLRKYYRQPPKQSRFPRPVDNLRIFKA